MSKEPASRTVPYRVERAGYAFELPSAEVAVLRRLPDFELEQEPAVADEFLRFRAERWADNLSDAGVAPGPVDVRIDLHQRRAKLERGGKLLFSAEI
jgi:hypothetical protein